MERGKYIVEMQVARGIGILLVAVGHSEPVKFVFPTLFDIIYSFHMPLFFFLSGFFSDRLARVDSVREWMRVVPARLMYLVIPYLAVNLSYSFLKYLVPELAVRPVAPAELLQHILFYPTLSPALFLWFLYTIIIMQALTPMLIRIKWYCVFAVLMAFQVLRPDISLFGIGLVVNYLLYYYIGLLASNRQEEFLALLRRKYIPFLALAMFIGAYLVRVNSGIILFNPFIALAGTLFVLSMCFSYFRYLPQKALETAGKYSFSIYLLQYFFIFPVYFLLRSIPLKGELIVPFTFAVGVAGPLFLVFYVFPYSRVLSLLFSGIQRSSAKSGQSR